MEEKIKEIFSLPEDDRMEYFLRNIGLKVRENAAIECVDLSDNIIYMVSLKFGKFAFKLNDLSIVIVSGEMKNMDTIISFFTNEIFKTE